MTPLSAILAAWVVASVPAALVFGRLLARAGEALSATPPAQVGIPATHWSHGMFQSGVV